MINYIIGGTVATLLGGNLMQTLSESIVSTLFTSASFIRNGSESNKMISKIRLQIEEMDIPIKLKLVQTLLDKLPKTETNSILEEGLVEIMFKIKQLIEWIDYEIKKHYEKWFSSYRSITVNEKLEELAHLGKLLDGRINLLLIGRPSASI
jgi:hypothetical protein